MEKWRAKSRACSSFSLPLKGLFIKNLFWQANQSIPQTTVTFLGSLRKNMRRLRLELWRQKKWLFHHNNAPSHTFFSTWEFWTWNNVTLISWLSIKLKGRHFDTTEVIEAESQAVLNSLTEHDFQVAFKNERSAGNGVYAWKGIISRVMVASSPEVSCYQMAAHIAAHWAIIKCISCLHTPVLICYCSNIDRS
jgi:hypothetical protein